MNRSNFGFKGWRFSLPPTVSHTVYDSYFTRLSNISVARYGRSGRTSIAPCGANDRQEYNTDPGYVNRVSGKNFPFREFFLYAAVCVRARAVAPVQSRGSAIINCRRNYLALSITPSLPVRDAYVSTKSHPHRRSIRPRLRLGARRLLLLTIDKIIHPPIVRGNR